MPPAGHCGDRLAQLPQPIGPVSRVPLFGLGQLVQHCRAVGVAFGVAERVVQRGSVDLGLEVRAVSLRLRPLVLLRHASRS